MARQQSKKEFCYTKEDAFQTLQSTQSWISAMDAKASYAITLVGVLIGFMLSNDDRSLNVASFFEKASRHLCDGIFDWSLLILALLYAISFCTIICFLQVLFARTKVKSQKKSNFFFGTIAARDLSSFISSVRGQSESNILDDLLEQIHVNSQICIRKSKWYNRGNGFLIATIILWFLVAVFKM